MLVGGVNVRKFPALSGKVPEIRRKRPEQEHFYVMSQILVLNYVPTEVIPKVFPPFTYRCSPKAIRNISLPDIDRSRAVIKDVNTVLRMFLQGSLNILYVLRGSCPHFTELVDQFHRFPTC